eukprot:1208470-Amphidinium_carterae.1
MLKSRASHFGLLAGLVCILRQWLVSCASFCRCDVFMICSNVAVQTMCGPLVSPLCSNEDAASPASLALVSEERGSKCCARSAYAWTAKVHLLMVDQPRYTGLLMKKQEHLVQSFMIEWTHPPSPSIHV